MSGLRYTLLNISPPLALILVLLYAVLLLVQLWGAAFETETFFKLTVTFGVVVASLVAVFLVVRELGEEAELKKDKYMD